MCGREYIVGHALTLNNISIAMSLMQLNTGGLVTCELRVLITELREGRDE